MNSFGGRESQSKGGRFMPVSVKLDPKKKTLTIKMPLEKARRSASGKTLVVASTHGCKISEAVLSGRPVVVTANAFVYPRKQPSRPGTVVHPRRKPVQTNGGKRRSQAGLKTRVEVNDVEAAC
jgi:hypothetical protein